MSDEERKKHEIYIIWLAVGRVESSRNIELVTKQINSVDFPKL